MSITNDDPVCCDVAAATRLFAASVARDQGAAAAAAAAAAAGRAAEETAAAVCARFATETRCLCLPGSDRSFPPYMHKHKLRTRIKYTARGIE